MSFTVGEFTRVFGIPRVKGEKIDTSQKISSENRATLLQLMLRDNLTQGEKDSFKSAGKSWG